MTPPETLLLAAVGAAAGYGQGMVSHGVKPAARAKASGRPWPSRLVNIAKQAGLTHPIVYGADTGVQYLAETSSGGIALFDYDGDGWLDIFIVSGTRFGGAPPEATNRLYRNNHDGTFTDVTDKAGLRRTGWGQGVAVGDYNNDGRLDLFVTYWGENALYRNNGDGTFTDVAREAGLIPKEAGRTQPGTQARLFSTTTATATWICSSRRTRITICAALPSPAKIRILQLERRADTLRAARSAPRPPLPVSQPRRRHVRGCFGEVRNRRRRTPRSASPRLRADFDDDGWPDILLACDSTPTLFFHNNHDGTFTEEGIERGVALNADGMEQAGMGVAVRRLQQRRHPRYFQDALRRRHAGRSTRGWERASINDVTLKAGLAVETRYIAWGVGMPDLDNDGWPDIFYVTGNVYPDTERAAAGISVSHAADAVSQPGQRQVRAAWAGGRSGAGGAAFLARHRVRRHR